MCPGGSEERKLWNSPIYRFRLLSDPNNESSDMKEIVLDVTGSAPSMMEPSGELKSILLEIFSSSEYTSIDTVLEFGAAKLRNIPFILDQNKRVCAVEFEELMENEKSKMNIEKCDRYGDKFERVIFPNPFIQYQKKFDLIILMNVIPVMPVPAERLYLLDLLHSKVNDDKYLLWIAQKEGEYKKDRQSGKYQCGDGIWMMKKNRFKTFFRYHSVEEVIEIMSAYGFEKVKRFNKGGSDAILFKKIRHNPLTGYLTEDMIMREIPLDATIADPVNEKLKIVSSGEGLDLVIPNPTSLSIENIYVEKLRSIPPGQENAEKYHRVASNALSRIFRGSLRNMQMKVDMSEGVQEIDSVFTNDANSGFFKIVRDRYRSTHIMVEFKNISHDPRNTEFQQLNGRLGDRTGSFGILACRKVEDKRAVISRCKEYLHSQHYLIYLTDQDIIELLDCEREGNVDAIDDYMDTRLEEVLF